MTSTEKELLKPTSMNIPVKLWEDFHVIIVRKYTDSPKEEKKSMTGVIIDLIRQYVKDNKKYLHQ
jgi:hypothetical protein